MTLYDELYFEINLIGPKSEIKKFVRYLQSGELDDFFEITSDYINYEDNYEKRPGVYLHIWRQLTGA